MQRRSCGTVALYHPFYFSIFFADMVRKKKKKRKKRTIKDYDSTASNDDIGSEVHYLFICKFQYLSNLRKKIIPQYYTTYPNDHKLAVLFRGGSRISS